MPIFVIENIFYINYFNIYVFDKYILELQKYFL